MGLFGKLMGEFVDIIEWVDATSNTLIWKFPRQDNAIYE
jgi:membrane protease subunit (stomatin/prohibitin family)